jgi:hypothetical protein|tara:strand:- start:342 stop:986 length:645 start_codon:yes stop_codon:yes gene_type:complete
MKKSEFKAQIKEEIIDILEAVDQEDVKAQQDYNAELEKTAQLKKDAGIEEGNDSDKFQDDGYVNHTYNDSVIDKYNVPVEPTAVFEDDSYADFQDIGQAYLENMGRPHSLNDDELEYLGKRIVKQLYKGDISKAYDEIVMYDPRKLKEEDEEPKAGDLKGEPLSKIGYKLAATQEEMRKVVKKYSALPEGPEKEELKDRLRELTKIKKELESLL